MDRAVLNDSNLINANLSRAILTRWVSYSPPQKQRKVEPLVSR